MKKIYLCIFLIFILLGICQGKVEASTTGYSEYKEIKFPDKYMKLLIEMDKGEQNSYLKKIKRKFIGWQFKIINYPIVGTFVGNTIFSRYNNTEQIIDFNYSSSIVKTTESSVKTIGTISASGSAKGKSISGSLEGQIRKEIGEVRTDKITEETEFMVKIMPGRKVSLIIKGNVRVSNGVAKYFLCGICFKKGAWELVDLVSDYYELCEEIIKK